MSERAYGVGLENAWSDERRRLAAAEEMFDPATFRHLDTIGIAAGMRCLEIGGGAGSVGRFMTGRVGPTGRVLITDLDTRHIEGCEGPNAEVRVHDICADPLEEGFDVIHARLVLEHLPARFAVLDKLVTALRPGGWLLIEDLDFTAGRPSSSEHAAVRGPLEVLSVLETMLPGYRCAWDQVGGRLLRVRSESPDTPGQCWAGQRGCRVVLSPHPRRHLHVKFQHAFVASGWGGSGRHRQGFATRPGLGDLHLRETGLHEHELSGRVRLGPSTRVARRGRT